MRTKHPKVTAICQNCSTEFEVKDHPERPRKFCSISCSKTGKFNPNKNGKSSLYGEDHPQWKGDSVGIDALHVYIHRRLPKPDKCQECKNAPPVDLANISNEYKRDISDWEWLCRRCHMYKDGRLKTLIENGKKATTIRRK